MKCGNKWKLAFPFLSILTLGILPLSHSHWMTDELDIKGAFTPWYGNSVKYAFSKIWEIKFGNKALNKGKKICVKKVWKKCKKSVEQVLKKFGIFFWKVWKQCTIYSKSSAPQFIEGAPVFLSLGSKTFCQAPAMALLSSKSRSLNGCYQRTAASGGLTGR